ncbi:SDR family NAD(P)-dependent oxidoreductase [Mycolicibacterium nivoides]|uniref:SDR family NAD(P)-dependent oxidoreductase n=1 Tax=Mycolicibacterium nivoides TaxID=2487344 RepID=UPI003C2E5CA6
MTLEFAGKTVLISGSARGQGAAHAMRFAEEGANVVVSDVRDELGEGVAERVRQKDGRAVYQHLDVRVTAQWDQAVARAENEFGGLDILINNAGIVSCDAVDACSDDTWGIVLDTNAAGVFKGMRAAVPALKRAGGGAIVNTASMMGVVGSWGYAAYVSSKFAVVGLTKSAALTYAADNIRVNAIAPGCVDTPMLDEEKAIMASNPYWDFDEWVATQPISKIAQPEEVSELVLFLASDRTRYCTGGVYPIDGGSTAG